MDRPLQRDFYAEMCRIEGWSTRTLRERIASMLYERTALSKKPDEMIQQELATLRSKGEVAPALVLKDLYVLDFLGLTDRFLERGSRRRGARGKVKDNQSLAGLWHGAASRA